MKIIPLIQIILVLMALIVMSYNLIYSSGLKKTEMRIGIAAPPKLDALLKMDVTFSILTALFMLLFLLVAVVI